MSIEAEVWAERVTAALQQIPVAVTVTVVNACLMAMALALAGVGPGILSWLVLSVLVGAARLTVWWRHRKAPPAFAHIRHWALASVSGALAAGLVWGGGSALLFPSVEIYQLFWVFLIGGMCAGAAALHYAHLPTALAFIMSASLPLALRLALEGTARGAVAGTMITIFVVALAVTSRRSSNYFGETLRLQLELAQRTRELNASNERLRLEITERVATEARLQHAQKMEALGQLAGGIAHDFNNVLQAVSSGLSLIQRRADNAGAVRQIAGAAADAVGRGTAVTRRLLSFSRKDALTAAAVPVKPFLQEMHTLLAPSLGTGIELRIRVDADTPPFFVDKAQLETILVNLAVNSRDSMPHGGSVTISARREVIVESGEHQPGPREGTYVRLDIEDTGTGMDPETLARASEPFFTTKPPGQGTGLGLAMARGFAEQSDGGFAIRSSPGQGTTVTLWLPPAPRMSETHPRRTPPHEMSFPGGGQRILVVDDDAMVRTVLAAELEDAGYRITEASDGAGALAKLDASGTVDAIVTDFLMPGMNGLSLIDEVRRRRPDLPAILLTGYADSKLKAEIEDLGDRHVLLMRKPVSGDELIRSVAAVVEAKSPPAAENENAARPVR